MVKIPRLSLEGMRVQSLVGEVPHAVRCSQKKKQKETSTLTSPCEKIISKYIINLNIKAKF